jgi:hypothetical protein
MAQKREEKVAQKKTSSPKANRLGEFFASEAFPWVARGVFFLVGLILLGFVYDDVLTQYFERSYFLYDSEFAKEKIFRSGGLLVYLSLFLNQLFAYPFVAALLVSLGLVFLQWGFSRWLGKSLFASYLPSVLLLFYLLDVRYAIYWGSVAYLWTPLLGLFFTLGVLELLRICFDNCEKRSLLWMGGAFCSVLFFPLIGVFSFLPHVIFGVLKRRWGWLGLLVGLYFFEVWFVSVFYHEHYLYSVRAPFALQNGRLFPWFAIGASLVLPLLAIGKCNQKKVCWDVFALFCLIGSLFVYVSLPANVNFRTDMNLLCLTEKHEWKKVLGKVKGLDQLTHVQSSFRIIALANTGRLSSQLFNLPLPYKKHPEDDGSELFVATAYVQLYASMFSVASQMNMEQWTMFGPSNAGLKMFVLLNILTDNDRLARRYIGVMKKSAGLADEAEKCENWVNDKVTFFQQHPEFMFLKNNQFVENLDVNAKSHLAYLLLSYRKLTEENMERRLLANLYIRSLDGFLQDFSMVRPDQYSVWPQYFQEAFILKALATNDLERLARLPIDKDLIHKVRMLVGVVQRAGDEDLSAVARRVYPKYRNMYSFYYLFPDWETLPNLEVEEHE